MADRTELRSGLAARKPLVYIAHDGREWEFPPDLPADAFLDFIEKYGEELAEAEPGAALTLPAQRAFMEAVVGADRLAEIRKEVSYRELIHMMWTLYFHYQRAPDEGDVANPPEAQAS